MSRLVEVKKYSQVFSNCFDDVVNKRRIGLEMEYPLIQADGSAITHFQLEQLYSNLNHLFGYDCIYDKETGVVDNVYKNTHVDGVVHNYDSIKTDGGICTLEVATAPEENLFQLEERILRILNEVNVVLKPMGCHILNFGIQPVTEPQRDLRAQKGRYQFLEDISLNTYVSKDMGKDWHVFTTSASSQCHVEVPRGEILDVVNVLNAFTGLHIALGANSSIWKGGVDDKHKAVRETFWDLGWPERKNQIGIHDKLNSFEDYIEILFDFAPLFCKRDGRFLLIQNKKTFYDYITSSQKVHTKDINGRIVEIVPSLDDFMMNAGLAWFSARACPSFGTVESRVFCQQPQKDLLAPCAHVLGIAENIKHALKVMERYSWKSWQGLRYESICNGFDSKISNDSIGPLIREILDVSRDGLLKRGLGEEMYLQPFYDRLANEMSPSDIAISSFNNNGLMNFIKERVYV